MRCLIVSPVPTVPANQGNAVLVAATGRWLQQAGYHVHMVYSAMEGYDSDQIEAMAREWDSLDVIPHSGILPEPGRDGYPLDAWFDPVVADHVAALCHQWRFDFALVHYLWMSAVFEAMPASLSKFLLTHDRFGDRHVMLARSGIAPTWYSVTVAEEARGLDRADVVIATQAGEAQYFRSICNRETLVLGMPSALREVARRHRGDGRLRAGYIGSENPGNLHSLRALLAAIEVSGRLHPENFELLVAGPICAALNPGKIPDWCRLMGEIGAAEELFRKIDVMVNPSFGGSGVKIKSVECLALGVPLLTTRDGASGLNSAAPDLNCLDSHEIVSRLCEMLDNAALNQGSAEGRRTIEHYLSDQCAAIGSLLDRLKVHT